jgi:hypothetical protein
MLPKQNAEKEGQGTDIPTAWDVVNVIIRLDRMIQGRAIHKSPLQKIGIWLPTSAGMTATNVSSSLGDSRRGE